MSSTRIKITCHDMYNLIEGNKPAGKSFYNLCSKFLNESIQKKDDITFVNKKGQKRRRIMWSKAFYLENAKKLLIMKYQTDTGRKSHWREHYQGLLDGLERIKNNG